VEKGNEMRKCIDCGAEYENQCARAVRCDACQREYRRRYVARYQQQRASGEIRVRQTQVCHRCGHKLRDYWVRLHAYEGVNNRAGIRQVALELGALVGDRWCVAEMRRQARKGGAQ
jgi:DNA-directed RNA polymerase subunit RPC12/RpoP